jgi:hypothetical protein
MKNAKEKAKKLVDKYRTYIRMADKYEYNLSQDEIYLAKQCALIAVDEIITAIENVFTKSVSKLNSTYRYYEEVKTEIKKL